MNNKFKLHDGIIMKKQKNNTSHGYQSTHIHTSRNNESHESHKIKKQSIYNTAINKKKRNFQINHNLELLKRSTIYNNTQRIYEKDKFQTEKKSVITNKIEDQFQSKYSDLSKSVQFKYNPETGALSRLKTLTFGEEEISQLVNRFQINEKKRKSKIQKLKTQIQIQQSKNIQEKPIISVKSSEISQILKNQPLHKRYESYLSSKKKKIEQQQAKKLKLQKQYQQKQKLEYQQLHKIPDNKRSYEQFFQGMVRWQNKKNERSKAKKQQLSKSEMIQVTFKPEINSKSKKMNLNIEKKSLKTKQVQNNSKLDQFLSIVTKPQKQNILKNKYGK